MVAQIAKLEELRYNINILFTVLSPTLVCFVYVIKYQTFCIVARKIRGLIEYVEKDWNMLKDKKEVEILGRYTYFGNLFTFGFTILAVLGIVGMCLVPFVPNVLDILMPLNVSRQRHLLFPGKFFVDHQKYFYVITLHVGVSLFLIFITLVGTESLYVTHVLHACGMFQVASYRLDQAFDNKVWQTYPPDKRAIIVHKKLIEAVRIHKRALEFSEFLWSTLAVSYSILLMLGIASLVIHLFCLFEAILIIKEMNEFLKLSMFSFGHVFYLFLGNYIGQILIDHSTGIFQNTYGTKWHDAPVQAQKLLPVIMQRSTRSCKMVVGGGLYIPSFEGFASMAKIVTSKYDPIIVLRVLSFCAPSLIVTVKYITFLLLPASLKKLMKLVENDWNVLKDVKEIEMIRRYTHVGRLCTIIITVFGFTSAIALLMTVLFPDILDIVAPLNASRQHRLPIDVDYFVDQEKHFKVIFCHMYITIVISIATVLATESLYVAYVHHACGMFKIARCDTQWYRVPLQEQKLILLILNRSMQSCKLITGGTFVLSLEGFTSLLATSISYFTVLSSVQH
ncbi:uncharacterized protein LOC109858666 [Pseudomyrmex gracilis]|uniref:uncharacterized protein LOC109858666 n=1 Tax=Pseudomyrmex gracilis TaxID=219809 RepID=UPI000994A2CD|nr:uncharacterized protein LOC109858666 [Pseudomyrmex gracilis]